MSGSLLNFALTVAATVVGAFLIAVGSAFWRLSGDVRMMRQMLEADRKDWERRFSELSKDVELLKSLIEQGRTWRWSSGPLPGEKEQR